MSNSYRNYIFEEYGVNHFATGMPFVNQIYCYDEETLLGYLSFYPKDQVPLSKVTFTPDMKFFLNYEVERYQEIIETFRYEKPIQGYVSWNEENIVTMGLVGTCDEPVGEQEGRHALRAK